MLDSKRREFITLLGGGGLLLVAKVRRARGQQPAMPVVGLLSGTDRDASRLDAIWRPSRCRSQAGGKRTARLVATTTEDRLSRRNTRRLVRPV
jgi:hypothetical protein